MERQIPVAICLRNRLLREGVSLILKAANYRVYASVDGSETIKFKAGSRFILIVGDQRDGSFDPAAIANLKRRFSRSLIVLLLDSYTQEHRRQIDRLDIAGVLLKSISSEVLVASLRLVVLGERVFSIPILIDTSARAAVLVERSEKTNGEIMVFPEREGHPGALIEHRPEGPYSVQSHGEPKIARRSELSNREMEILTCLVAGHSNKLIARRCRITEATVKVHLKAILRKTEVVNRTQAAVWALNNMDLGTPASLRCAAEPEPWTVSGSEGTSS